jgi:NAD-dependent DNA ligase
VDEDGNAISRTDLEELAAQCGLQPVRSVTKKGCDLLVASDPASSSGKAAKARKWGIPVMAVDEFVSHLNGSG